MNIAIFGAGAIGSFFGALLSKKNNVVLVGRKNHVATIKKNGLKIQGKTNLHVTVKAVESAKKISFIPDLLILAVKSYDTEPAIKQAKSLIGENTVVMSLQNGLDNIEKIEKNVKHQNIIVCITTNGVIFSKPGVITHTGIGKTTIGELNGEETKRIKDIVNIFNNAGLKTIVNNNIMTEIWIKAIINSSINPLTTLFQCKNGYLIKNPVLERLVEKICLESTNIAKANGLNLSYNDMIKNTKEVINDTAENYSSMFQSYERGKKTEIDSINGKMVEVGKTYGVDTSINESLVNLIKFLETN